MRAEITVADRSARGRAARTTCPRSSHADIGGADARPDPVDLLESQSARRQSKLVPIRYGRMAASPLAFFRGSALVMASDLAQTADSGLAVQLCGDAHLSNFGAFASPERRLMFDLNDFDETCPGPWEWDVKRLAASLEVAGRSNGFDPGTRERMVSACVWRYRWSMRRLSAMRDLDLWYARTDLDLIKWRRYLDKRQRQLAVRSVAKARSRHHLQVRRKLTEMHDGHRRFASNPPLLVPVRELRPELEHEQITEWMRMLLHAYAETLTPERRHLLLQYRFVDIAHKVVGVGSVGTHAWVTLLVGRDDHDPLFLQVKEAKPLVIAEYTGLNTYENQGERVVAGQRLMQSVGDILLGWHRVQSMDGTLADYYVRQLRDWKLSVEIETLTPRGLSVYGQLCGWTLARAHARSGDRIAISGYLGSNDSFERALVAYAREYANRNERDHQALKAAIDSGRLTARTDL